jgi:hypothetical protein
MYDIVRFYQDPGRRPRTIERSVTLKEAQEHCKDPESSSSTATSATARAITRRNGPWFDGYCER